MSILFRGSATQRLRLASGLILFAFVLCHFTNHAVGLVSVEAMQVGQDWRTAVTRSLPGSIILGSALVLHMGLALWKFASRATLKLPLWELTQLLLGLAIPLLLFPHLVQTRIAHEFFGVEDSYLYQLVRLWPNKATDQIALLTIVWLHGCVGIHFWLRLAPWYQRIAPVLLAFAVLLPALAISGFTVAGRAAEQTAANPQTLTYIKYYARWPDAETSQTLALIIEVMRIGFYIVVALAAAAVVWRLARRWRGPRFPVKYRPAPLVKTAAGPTLLEISRMHGIPHLSVCGGRARCSTCRVQIVEGAALLAPPSRAEADTLRSIGAADGVRLACQIRPIAPIAVALVLRPSDVALATHAPGDVHGVERQLAVLFLDMRGFTTLSENKLPYDVVFMLNQLFAAAGAAIEDEGGWIDKYLGDGLLAVFGRERGAMEGCRQALRAARRIDLAVAGLNARLASEFGAPLRVGMGVHVGPLVLGRIGHGKSAALTVIGKTVNAASRLETLTKQFQCQLVVSREAAEIAGAVLDGASRETIGVRGLSRPVTVYCIRHARGVVLPDDPPVER